MSAESQHELMILTHRLGVLVLRKARELQAVTTISMEIDSLTREIQVLEETREMEAHQNAQNIRSIRQSIE